MFVPFVFKKSIHFSGNGSAGNDVGLVYRPSTLSQHRSENAGGKSKQNQGPRGTALGFRTAESPDVITGSLAHLFVCLLALLTHSFAPH